MFLAARAEYLTALHYMSEPHIVQGRIKQLCKATIPARRESRLSGFDYVVVEYEVDTDGNISPRVVILVLVMVVLFFIMFIGGFLAQW